MRLGVLGGTFDPVHVGHLTIAQEARDQLGLDRVLFIPAGRPLLRVAATVADGRHRLAMLRVAVGDNPAFAVSTMELDRPGPSYTVDTLDTLGREHGPDTALFFVIGADALAQITAWKDPCRVLGQCTLAVAPRPGHEPRAPVIEGCSAPARMTVLEGPAIGISASRVRERAAAGLSLRSWVPPGVDEYIASHGLYRKGGDEG